MDDAVTRALQERGWWAPTRADHPLGRLQGRSLGEGRLLALLGPKNSVGARYFQLFLRTPNGGLSHAFLLGLHNSGRFPAYNWIDVARYDGAAGKAAAMATELRALLTVPPSQERREWEAPARRLARRVLRRLGPRLTTPTGHE
jgi:hypothetical protein